MQIVAEEKPVRAGGEELGGRKLFSVPEALALHLLEGQVDARVSVLELRDARLAPLRLDLVTQRRLIQRDRPEARGQLVKGGLVGDFDFHFGRRRSGG